MFLVFVFVSRLSVRSSAGDEGAAEAAYSLIRTMSSSKGGPAAGEDAPEKDATKGDGDDCALSAPTARDYLSALRVCAAGSSNNQGNNSNNWSVALRLLTETKLAAATAQKKSEKLTLKKMSTSLFADSTRSTEATTPASTTTTTTTPATGNVEALPEVGGQKTATESGSADNVPFGKLSEEHYHAAITACGRSGKTSCVVDLLSELRYRGKGKGGRGVKSGSGAGLQPSAFGGTVREESGGEEEDLRLADEEATKEAAAARVIPKLSTVSAFFGTGRGVRSYLRGVSSRPEKKTRVVILNQQVTNTALVRRHQWGCVWDFWRERPRVKSLCFVVESSSKTELG